MSIYRTHILIPVDPDTVLAGVFTIKKMLERALIRRKLDQEIKVLESGTVGVVGKGVILVVYPEKRPASNPGSIERTSDRLPPGRFGPMPLCPDGRLPGESLFSRNGCRNRRKAKGLFPDDKASFQMKSRSRPCSDTGGTLRIQGRSRRSPTRG